VTIIKFPSKLPKAEGLDRAKAELSRLFENMAGLAAARAAEARKAENPGELAAIVSDAFNDAAEASTGWATVRQNLRDSWGV
jgi:hypothetical protein